MKQDDMTLLFVDDEKKTCAYLEELFKDEVKNLFIAHDGNEALEILQNNHVDVVISDLEMPVCNGFELARKIREFDEHLPIVALSAYKTNAYLIKGYRSGINLYHTKPIHEINTLLNDCKKLKKTYDEVISNKKIAHKLLEKNKMLAEEVLHDPLTNLYNRKGVSTYYETYFNAEKEFDGFSVVMADIDDFKQINDTYGHNIGDQVLCKIASIFQEQTRENDIIGRWGGEEFIFILGFFDDKIVMNALDRIRQRVHEEVEFGDRVVSVSFGYAVYSSSDKKASFLELVNEADQALYEAKKSGKNCVKRYEK